MKPLSLLLALFAATVVATPQLDQTQFSAVVKKDEATFSLPVPLRDRWVWRLKQTKANAQEYRMDVTVKNEDREYTFGYYLWKREGAGQESGDFASLLAAGQKSLFERTEPRRMTIVRDANVKIKVKNKSLVIQLRDKDDVKRIFSSRPAEAMFKIKVPDEPEVVQKIPIVYQ
jgi:hypothetical protein